jgi:hypothetical protein
MQLPDFRQWMWPAIVAVVVLVVFVFMSKRKTKGPKGERLAIGTIIGALMGRYSASQEFKRWLNQPEPAAVEADRLEQIRLLASGAAIKPPPKAG